MKGERPQNEGKRAKETLWRESVRRYEERESRQRLWEKLRYPEGQTTRHTATFEVIMDRHREEVTRCEALLGLNGHHHKESA